MATLHSSEPSQSMPNRGMNMGQRCGFSSMSMDSSVRASRPIMSQDMYSHAVKNER